MERGMIGTIGIAVISSMVVAALLILPGDGDRINILNVEYPATLIAAISDSVGENAFALAFTCLQPQVRVVVEYGFLYGPGIAGEPGEVLDAVDAILKVAPAEYVRTSSGTVSFNGSHVAYTFYDFRDCVESSTIEGECVFLVLEEGEDLVASFSGVPDLFNDRELGSLLDATVTRSGNRTYYSRRSLEEVGSVPMEDLPTGGLAFDNVDADETIEISFRADAFFTRADRVGAVQVINIVCDEDREILILNFMKL